jgi:hypothetical protein
MGESGLTKAEAKRFMAQSDMQRALSAGGNESDVGVWRQVITTLGNTTLNPC